MENNISPAGQGSSSNSILGADTNILCAEIKKLNDNLLSKIEVIRAEGAQNYQSLSNKIEVIRAEGAQNYQSLSNKMDEHDKKIQALYDYFLSTLTLRDIANKILI